MQASDPFQMEKPEEDYRCLTPVDRSGEAAGVTDNIFRCTLAETS